MFRSSPNRLYYEVNLVFHRIMSEQAKVAFSIRGNTLEISGPEGFVSAQVELFREAILSCWTTAANSPADDAVIEADQPPPAPHREPAGGKQYQNVLHIEEDKVQILKSVPGTTNSKKAVGTTLIYLWAKRENGVDAVPFSELREVCKQHGCLDAPNFATTMKSARAWIVVEGEIRSQTCKLTVPGVEKAETLLKQLNGEQSLQDS